ncbi:MAG TPA: S8 family peptidase [Candidatus Paceibacterota bacterium]|nr:S8 family peptidase [Candidatus Paceibacterota bacterium]
MSENENRRPILYKGEVYTKPITKTAGGRQKEPRASYAEARERVLGGIKATKEKVLSLSAENRMPNEFIFCLRLDPAFSAKSYYPETLFPAAAPNSGFEDVGSRVWRQTGRRGSEVNAGKLLFVRATEQGLARFESRLNQAESSLHENFKTDIRKIHAVDTLESSEQILGIPDDWREGRLEAVLHPFKLDRELVIKNFLEVATKAGVADTSIKYKQYESGVTFVSLWGNRSILKTLSDFNPLRTAHPLEMRDFAIITRGQPVSGAPLPPTSTEKSDVVIGVFDGGLQANNPYTSHFADGIDLTRLPANPTFVDHGTQVTGAILYGPLNQYPDGVELPRPTLAVRNFRVLPADDTAQPDIYEIIDAIEDTVPKNKDIRVYNLSIGPAEPILDDAIGRFTFACDLLAEKENVLFNSAVGNDGSRTPDYLKRIQSPSDMVNGLGVGAYTKRDGKILKAPYSCVGPGREGNKMKPDLVAFGGCDQTPIHLVGGKADEKVLSRGGTSFATPIVSRYAGHLIGYSRGAIGPLTGRAMLIHSAVSNKRDGHSNELGHGILTENLQDIVTCEKGTYTLIYEAELLPGKYAEFKIPWIEGISSGEALFRWTSVVCTKIDPQSPDDYTSSSIMVAFYPDGAQYEFSRKSAAGKTEKKRVNVSKDPALVAKLVADGWKQSAFPVNQNGPNPYSSEEDLRKEMKWDSVDCRLVNKRTSGVSNPVFHVHALARGQRNITEKIKFAIILSVELSDKSIDLYSQVVNKFDALLPVQMRLTAEAEAQVKVEA